MPNTNFSTCIPTEQRQEQRFTDKSVVLWVSNKIICYLRIRNNYCFLYRYEEVFFPDGTRRGEWDTTPCFFCCLEDASEMMTHLFETVGVSPSGIRELFEAAISFYGIPHEVEEEEFIGRHPNREERNMNSPKDDIGLSEQDFLENE